MIRDVTDDQLIKAIARRDEQALSLLYDRYAAEILRVAHRLVGERNAAEAVLQEVFWQVWRQARGIGRGKTAVSTWLYKTARQLALQQRKSPDCTLRLALVESKSGV